MSTRYHVERAKSGRSKCKKCKETIDKDDIRIGSSIERDDHVMTSWHHVKCFSLPRSWKKEGIEVFIRDALHDPENLLDECRDEIMQDLLPQMSASAKKSKEKVAFDTSTILGKIKRNHMDMDSGRSNCDDEEIVENASKKMRKLCDEELNEVKLYEFYKNKNADELKDYMRWNHQTVGGRKDVLILRCIDGEIRGRLARCPMCKQGRPKIAEETHDFVSCNGYFDEDAQVRVSCSFQISLSKASRLHPWYTERPTEEQEEAMKAQYEVGTKTSSKGILGENQNESVIQSAIDKAKAIEWKTSNKTEIMATTSALVKICKECGIDLPKDMETKTVGKLVVANAKSSTAPKVLQMILDEYGFVKDKEAADKLTDDVAAQICQVPENAPLYKMLDEFAELMRKSGEFMKSNMQKKSAQAVAALKFEVTEDNALKLGKPGKSKIPGIGKSTAEKMHEFLTTGTVTKLEELRASIE